MIHLSGLYRMIELRGGIPRLMKENSSLALKALRLDVELALQTGSPLFRNDVVPINTTSDNFRVIEELLPGAAPKLSHIMTDVAGFSALLNSKRKGQTKLDPQDFSTTILYLLYRLIEVAPLRQPHSAPATLHDDVAPLAMLAFMTTLLPEYGRERSSYPLLSNRLESTFHGLHARFAVVRNSNCSPLLLWCLFISGISILNHKQHPWLLLDLLQVCEQQDLHDWPSVRHQLSKFPWIHGLHDVPGQILWEDAHRRSNEISSEFLQLQ